MNISLQAISASLLLIALTQGANAQITAPEFLHCDSSILSLCTDDPGVSLPLSNQVYTGEENPLSTSCSVHLTQSESVNVSCGSEVQYEVQLFLFDAGAPVTLQSSTSAIVDTNGNAHLFFDSSMSPDSILRYNGIPYTSGCGSYHRMRWTVVDSCDQVSVCDRLIDLYDCYRDSLDVTQFNILHFPGCNPLRRLYLEDYVIALDDCAQFEDYQFSFYEDIHVPDSLIDACEFGFGVSIPFDLWIADSGLDNDCNGTIEWAERKKVRRLLEIAFTEDGCVHCPFPTASLSGVVKSTNSVGIKNAIVTANSLDTYLFNTDEGGLYHFPEVTIGLEVTVSVEKEDNFRNGISTIDLVLILRHVLGYKLITDPFKLHAADANLSGHVSTLDLIILRKLLLGKINTLPWSESWRFFPEDYIFPIYPPMSGEGYTFTMKNDTADINFIGVKVGDINNTAQSLASLIETRAALKPQVEIWLPLISVERNESLQIPVYINSIDKILGMQFSLMAQDLEFTSITSGQLEVNEDDFYSNKGQLRVSWFDSKPNSINASEPLFFIQAISKVQGKLSNLIEMDSKELSPEIYSGSEEIFTLGLQFHSNEIVSSTSSPNPWKNEVSLQFNLQVSSPYTIVISDVNGRTVYHNQLNGDKGANEIHLRDKDIAGNGLFFYSIESASEKITGKMVKAN
jgi:hypothetical protein